MSKSSITTEQIPNPTPGEVLLLEFIEPMRLTQNGLARAIGVPPRRINESVLGYQANAPSRQTLICGWPGILASPRVSGSASI